MTMEEGGTPEKSEYKLQRDAHVKMLEKRFGPVKTAVKMVANAL